MQSALFSVSAAASTSAGFKQSFAPLTTMIDLPGRIDENRRHSAGDTGNLPHMRGVDASFRVLDRRWAKQIVADAGHHEDFGSQSRAATAWFAPLPQTQVKFLAEDGSPGLGNWSENVVKSTLALPTTAMRGRFAIIFSVLRDLVPLVGPPVPPPSVFWNQRLSGWFLPGLWE